MPVTSSLPGSTFACAGRATTYAAEAAINSNAVNASFFVLRANTIARTTPQTASSETLNAGVGSRISATLSDPAKRTVPVIPSRDQPAKSDGIHASDCDTYDIASAATAVG